MSPDCNRTFSGWTILSPPPRFLFSSFKASGATAIKAGGLNVEAGGLQVGSGGATVGAGGLTVDGGFFLRSGALVIGDGESGDGFEVERPSQM